MHRGALGVANLFIGSQCARNCIPIIKSLAFSKIAQLEFFFRAFRVNKGSLGVFRGACNVANFL